MSELLFESPITVVVVGLMVTALAAIVWTQAETQLAQKTAAYCAAGSLAVTASLLVISMQVETDKEKIRRTMYSVASALQHNDLEKVYSSIHPNAAEGVQRAKAELPRYQFRDARVTRVKQILVKSSQIFCYQ